MFACCHYFQLILVFGFECTQLYVYECVCKRYNCLHITETIREICCGINISNHDIIQEAESQIGRLTSCLFYRSSLLALVMTSQESSLKNCGVVGYSVIFGGAALKHSPEFSSQTLFISFFQKQSRSLVQKKV